MGTEQDKVGYFTEVRGVSVERLPAKIYGASSASAVRRCFVEKYPILLPAATAREVAPEHSVSFCFVDEGFTTPSHFETFLMHYAPLFAALPHVRVVYVAARSTLFRSAERVFAKLLAKHFCDPSAGAFQDRGERLDQAKVRYFDLRRRFEAREFAGLDRAALLELRDARIAFSTPEYEREYDGWKAGATAKPRVPISETALFRAPAIAFSTHLLEHNYDLFGTLTAP